jgi:hypothetical protein
MEVSDRNDEQELKRELTETHIEQIDKMMPSPSERARIVWEAIQRNTKISYISNWDVVCFSVETLGLMSAEFPWMKEAAVQISKLVYRAHYLNHDKIRQHETEVIKTENEKDLILGD